MGNTSIKWMTMPPPALENPTTAEHLLRRITLSPRLTFGESNMEGAQTAAVISFFLLLAAALFVALANPDDGESRLGVVSFTLFALGVFFGIIAVHNRYGSESDRFIKVSIALFLLALTILSWFNGATIFAVIFGGVLALILVRFFSNYRRNSAAKRRGLRTSEDIYDELNTRAHAREAQPVPVAAVFPEEA